MTILIPTFNRPEHIFRLLDSFSKRAAGWHWKEIEFLVSENVAEADSVLGRMVTFFSSTLNVNLIHPDVHLISAEENLFFGWQFAQGKYVWTLGDDDPVNFDTFYDLLNKCRNEDFDVLKYNARLLYGNSKVSETLVTKSAVDAIQLTMKEFLRNVGLWHTGAGFSTWVFRNELISASDGLDWVQSFKSPVYAHVTFFLKNCSSQNVEFINQPLVYYRVNAYVSEETNEDNHWSRYANSAKIPRYLPWTLGFIEQIKLLEKCGIIDSRFWGSVVGDHFGTHRFLEFNSMVTLSIEQLKLEFHGTEFKYSSSEWHEMVSYFRSLRPELNSIWTLFERYASLKVNDSPRLRNRLLRIIYLSWHSYLKFDQFAHFKSRKGLCVYRFPSQDIVATSKKELQDKLFLGFNSRLLFAKNEADKYQNQNLRLKNTLYFIGSLLIKGSLSFIKFLPSSFLVIALKAVDILSTSRKILRIIWS